VGDPLGHVDFPRKSLTFQTWRESLALSIEIIKFHFGILHAVVLLASGTYKHMLIFNPL